ncbi:methyltransferase domain-containing protein [Portibacter lacus]|uniref:Tellurite resistance methyltransferase TehB-like domain-containing protein n=1 Tax=Portibacter lacus TaxID=1099794 RepID=A0AA37SPY9_9BACT|nr:methyltransferase domain-containing protein [Portibacter lacus]GLR17094.1 hypothetical protein GCM10007940_17090 [Portibacter lacus]
MKIGYDDYYQTENLFGKAYPELIQFYKSIQVKGRLLDLGCGQGRDAIPLAKLGFDVTGIDHSRVGIDQLNKIAKAQNLSLVGFVDDIYTYSDFDQFEFILLDSMFHFGKKEIEKEKALLNRLLTKAKSETIITICIQKVGKKLETLESIVSARADVEPIAQTELIYKFVDKASNHSSETKYEMLTIRKA